MHEAFDIPGMMEKFEQAVNMKGVRVFIPSHTCSLIEQRIFRKKGVKIPVVNVDPEKCNGCQTCIRKFGCPAINFDYETKKAYIDHIQCRGCLSCIDICPQDAFCEDK